MPGMLDLMDHFLASSDNGMYGLFTGGTSLFGWLVGYVIAGLCTMGMFKKAGKPQWAAFIPIYNWIVLLEIIGRPIWWVILLLIPCVNIVAWIILALDIAKSYGQSQGFGIALGVGIHLSDHHSRLLGNAELRTRAVHRSRSCAAAGSRLVLQRLVLSDWEAAR